MKQQKGSQEQGSQNVAAVVKTGEGERAKAMQSFRLPRPTVDQEEYLTRIHNSTGKYDRDVLVGGPRKKI
jgi:hypothetical protein